MSTVRSLPIRFGQNPVTTGNHLASVEVAAPTEPYAAAYKALLLAYNVLSVSMPSLWVPVVELSGSLARLDSGSVSQRTARGPFYTLPSGMRVLSRRREPTSEQRSTDALDAANIDPGKVRFTRNPQWPSPVLLYKSAPGPGAPTRY